MFKLLMLYIPWTTNVGVVVPITVAQWVWPVTVRPMRAFAPRVRFPRIEFGHVEGTIATDD